MTSDTKALIEMAIRHVFEEVPALKPLKLVLGLELRGRGDIQIYRVELPSLQITKDDAPDAKIRLNIPRSHFNELARDGKIRNWREAFKHGVVKASGSEDIMKLIVNVVNRQQARARTRKVRL